MAGDFKQTLWKAADKLRAQMDAAEYKHIVLGLIFLKYISDTFVKQQEKVKSMVSEPSSDYFISEDPAEYAGLSDNLFFIFLTLPLVVFGVPLIKKRKEDEE